MALPRQKHCQERNPRHSFYSPHMSNTKQVILCGTTGFPKTAVPEKKTRSNATIFYPIPKMSRTPVPSPISLMNPAILLDGSVPRTSLYSNLGIGTDTRNSTAVVPSLDTLLPPMYISVRDTSLPSVYVVWYEKIKAIYQESYS